MTEQEFEQFITKLQEIFGERSVDVLRMVGGQNVDPVVYLRGSKYGNSNDRNAAIIVMYFKLSQDGIKFNHGVLSLPMMGVLSEFSIDLSICSFM